MKPGMIQWLNRYKYRESSRQWVHYWEKWNAEFAVNCLPVLYSGGVDTITQNILIAILSGMIKLLGAAKMKMFLGALVPSLQFSIIKRRHAFKQGIVFPEISLKSVINNISSALPALLSDAFPHRVKALHRFRRSGCQGAISV